MLPVMTHFPQEPDVPLTQRAKESVLTRYEDVSQTGKLLLNAMPLALGPTLWRALWGHPMARAMHALGAIPIMSRLVLEQGQGPIPAVSRLEAEGSFQLAHTVSAAGAVDRLLLNMWCRLYGQAGKTHGAQPANAGERLPVGRIFAEHVLTRPFGPKEERKVVHLVGEGGPEVPPDRVEWRPPEAALALPAGAEWLDEDFRADAAPVLLGLDHTDSNQHVNSLVYPRLFVEAALRRLWEHGKRGAMSARAAEVAYRKPSFAGERLRITARAFARGEEVGIAGALIEEAEVGRPIDEVRPRCFTRLWMGEG
jgi:hypothetical protein